MEFLVICNEGRPVMGRKTTTGLQVPRLGPQVNTLCRQNIVVEPFRQLTRTGVPFRWGKEHKEAFGALKEALASAETLAYSDRMPRQESSLMLVQ